MIDRQNLYVGVLILFWSFFLSPFVFAVGKTCKTDAHFRDAQRAQLQTLYDEDKSDRGGWETMHDEIMEGVVARDAARVKSTLKIAEQDCLKTAQDYSMAAKILMHSGKTTHFLKALQLSKKALDLGDISTESKVQLAQSIDRYLVRTGHKQLFASQAIQTSDARCWCLNSVEKKFPDDRRREYIGRDLDEAFSWVDGLNHGLGCHLGRYCKDKLKDTPRGLVSGIW